MEVSLPEGYKPSAIAPFSLNRAIGGGAVQLPSGSDRSPVAPEFPIEVEAAFDAGSGLLPADPTIRCCRAPAPNLCLIGRVRLEPPGEVRPGGASGARSATCCRPDGSEPGCHPGTRGADRTTL